MLTSFVLDPKTVPLGRCLSITLLALNMNSMSLSANQPTDTMLYPSLGRTKTFVSSIFAVRNDILTSPRLDDKMEDLSASSIVYDS